MSVLKELEGKRTFLKQMKMTTHQTRGMQQISRVTTSHRPQRFPSRMQEYPNSKSGGRQTDQRRNWDKMFMKKNTVTQSHTQTTHNSHQINNFLSRDGKALLSFTPSSLCVSLPPSVLEVESFWADTNSLMRTTMFWVCLLDCWRTCSLTRRSHSALEGTESIIGQGLSLDWAQQWRLQEA